MQGVRAVHAYAACRAHALARTIHRDRLADTVNKLSRTSPASGFHRLYAIPFAPPLPAIAGLVVAKVPCGPNSDFDLTSPLINTAADLLPTITAASPRSARIYNAEDREKFISTWSKSVNAHPW